MSVWVNKCSYWLAVFGLLGAAASSAADYPLGQPASAEEIQGWDIDVRPDGLGLPEGSGDALAGEALFIEQCARCHGEFGEGVGRYPPLAGGEDSLDSDDPVKTVGSYWPYASTVFDYINRAMPFGHAQSLSADEVYAITAYVLNANDLIDDDFMLNQDNLASVQMPNREGFIQDTRPDVPMGAPCMHNCLPNAAKIVGRARQIDVTPEQRAEALAEDANAQRMQRGQAVYAQCQACHSLAQGAHKFGPSLHNLIDREAGSQVQFDQYSAALKSAKFSWTRENLYAFLRAPQEFLPGTSMPFAGIPQASSVDDLLFYLTAQAK